MIARTWTGTVRRTDADEYARYIRETGFAEYERTEFIALSLWDSEDAIRAFAGAGFGVPACC